MVAAVIGAILLGLILLAVITVISIYNSLIQIRVSVKNAWSQIDVQLKRRHDLIPNLVNVAKGYMAHERQTLEAVIKARQQAIDASSLKDKVQAENFLSQTLRSLFAVTENYPNLKADQQMKQLQEELVSTENKIAFARQFYNDETGRYNSSIQIFPNNIVAGTFNFQAQEFFEIQDAAEKQAPQVSF
ncbi:MAG: LemA family protein [Candidatus Omnitrophica bacterium]|nr:LemA family protein [Candidatus Omnitrophota bacterium]